MRKLHKFAFAGLQSIKKNIMNNKPPVYNPVSLIGGNKEERFKMIFALFNKDFNSKHKGRYIDCAKEESFEIDNQMELIFLENVQVLARNETMQRKVRDVVETCLNNHIQLVICSDKEIDTLEIDELLKSKMKYGLTLYLED